MAAVAHDHTSGERYEARLGQGATVDRRPLCAPPPPPMKESVIAVKGRLPPEAGWLHSRKLGCAALELCLTATGRLDGFVDLSDHEQAPWDYMGALLVCAEAGISAEDRHGRSLTIIDHAARRAPIAAAEPLLAELVAAVAAAPQR